MLCRVEPAHDAWALSVAPRIAASDRSSTSDAALGFGGSGCGTLLHVAGLHAKPLDSKVRGPVGAGSEQSPPLCCQCPVISIS